MTDDSLWIDRGAEAQNSGRNVRCFSAPAAEAKDLAASKYAAQMQYVYVTAVIF